MQTEVEATLQRISGHKVSCLTTKLHSFLRLSLVQKLDLVKGFWRRR